MPFFFDPHHYGTIVQLLVAGDVQASVREVGGSEGGPGGVQGYGVVVKTDEGETIIWSNQERQKWLCSIVDAEGNVATAGGDLDMASTPEDVARYIATYDYPIPEPQPEEDPVAVATVEGDGRGC